MWKGVAFYTLDLTNPETLDWVEEFMTAVRDWGYRFVKIDFIYAALLRGRRHDPTMTGVEAYRKGLETIRKSLGYDTIILGCGAPLLPSVGMVDVMRISADVAPKWRDWALRLVTHAPIEPSCENAVHGTVCRAAMHRRLWVNDPDCLLVRKRKSKLTLDEVRTLATVIFLSGGMTLISDDMSALEEDRWDILRSATPLLSVAAKPVDLFDSRDPAIFHLTVPGSDRHLAAIINWSDKPMEMSIDLDKLGIDSPHHAFEYWTENYLGILHGELGPFSLPPHGCAFVTLVPADDTPRMPAITFHMGQGAVGIRSEKVIDDAIEINFELMGRRAGAVYAISPGETSPRSVPVDFTNSGAVVVPLK